MESPSKHYNYPAVFRTQRDARRPYGLAKRVAEAVVVDLGVLHIADLTEEIADVFVHHIRVKVRNLSSPRITGLLQHLDYARALQLRARPPDLAAFGHALSFCVP